MKLVIDMQGAQSASRLRGIGRYTTSLVRAMLEQRSEDDEVFLILNSSFSESIEAIRAEFSDFLPAENFKVWYLPTPYKAENGSNEKQRLVAEKIREAFIASLQPDLVLLTSLFEGFEDSAVTSIGTFTSGVKTAVILYDLIPLIYRDIYLADVLADRWYTNKIDHLRRADLLLSISDSSGIEARDYLGFPEDSVVNISTACDSHFKPVEISVNKRSELLNRYAITKPFVMYTGNTDQRKNVEGLIRAFSILPSEVRCQHQLVIVCPEYKPFTDRLEKLAKQCGLQSGDLIITGYVCEADLLALYNMCELFVFPSWHEGFGLPALEAMACGRPVIGANTSSVPEVIGREDALFDPFNDSNMAEKLLEALTSEKIRNNLVTHGLLQAKRFSWEKTARLAWGALRKSLNKAEAVLDVRVENRLRLAYVSPIPTARSGVADYSADLLPELARHYRIDVIVCQEEPVKDPWILANCTLRDPAWFRSHANSFDRVLYHFGNSHFHSHMFRLVQEIPGVVVLHDFYLSGILANLYWTGKAPDLWRQALLEGHGWRALYSLFDVKDNAQSEWTYPSNYKVIQSALGVIVHSDYSVRLSNHWYGEKTGKSWHQIPLLRAPALNFSRNKSRELLGIRDDDFVVCSFGLMGKTKLNHRLLNAWLDSSMANNPSCRLVFVGQNENGEYGVGILRAIRGSSARVEITGWVDTETYDHWLAAADCAVQLRTLSRGETSAAVLDCMNYGLATIVNANGSMADLADDTVYKLPDEFSDSELVDALTSLWNKKARRLRLGSKARENIINKHNPRHCADLYANAIEASYRISDRSWPGLLRDIQRQDEEISKSDLLALAQSISNNFAPSPRRPQLLIDITTLVQNDLRTGIQRVVRAVLLELLHNPPGGWQVEPIYGVLNPVGYRYARRYTCEFLNIPSVCSEDELVEAYPGDIFLGLDLVHAIPVFEEFLLEWRIRGVKVYSVIYDLLPIFLPEKFVLGLDKAHHRWLDTVTRFDGAFAISQAVADELSLWLDTFGATQRKAAFNIHFFHLGADIDQSQPSMGIPEQASEVLDKLSKKPTFLMVGTVEARKGHAQVIDALEEVWAAGHHVNFVIVGKQGWKVEKLVERLRTHDRLNTSLFWLEGISDEYLEKIYAASTCLLAASEGEGFGLPLIEAARHKLPIIARDIPVFREVAGEHAYYFENDKSPRVLADTIRHWLELFETGSHPLSDGMLWLTWKESAFQLIHALMDAIPHRSWLPDGIQRYWGNDPRMHSEVGLPRGRSAVSTGKAGFLIYGPYAHLAAGRYRLEIEGHSEGGEENCWLDTSCDSGGVQLLKMGVPAADHQGNWAVSTELLLDHRVSDLEIRLWVSADANLSVQGISISPMEASELGLQESKAEECTEEVVEAT